MKITPATPESSVTDLSIVLVGTFNPAIFQPMWFAVQGLLRAAEAESAAVEIVHPDASVFATDWLSIQVLRNRFSASTKADVYKPHLLDLVQGALAKLPHTPVTQMGINTSVRVRFKSEVDWHAFGHFLVPKSPWQGFLNAPGMNMLQVRGERARRGHVLVQVEPELGSRRDVLVRFNEHFDSPEGMPATASTFGQLLAGEYDGAVASTEKSVEELVARFIDVGEVDAGDTT